MLRFEDEFGNFVGASRARLDFLTYMYGGGSNADVIAHNKIKEEHINNSKVIEYYQEKYNFLCKKNVDVIKKLFRL